MTDQELIDKIVLLFETHNIEPGEVYHAAYWKQHRTWMADRILQLVKEAGYVQLAEDQSLPDPNINYGVDANSARNTISPSWMYGLTKKQVYAIAQQDMFKTGYRKVKLCAS